LKARKAGHRASAVPSTATRMHINELSTTQALVA
jgi:hypothetical protein